MKKTIAVFLAAVFCLSLVGCALQTKTLHCDNCGAEVRVSAKSNMEESWIIYCKKCEEELGLDKLVEERT